jgi:photosystem II stability/assembly factor-like uncharacterized protein
MYTEDSGTTWSEQRNGLPQDHCFDIVLRHALDVKGETIAMGTSGGSLYISENGGDFWLCLNDHLPRVFSARFA